MPPPFAQNKSGRHISIDGLSWGGSAWSLQLHAMLSGPLGFVTYISVMLSIQFYRGLTLMMGKGPMGFLVPNSHKGLISTLFQSD